MNLRNRYFLLFDVLLTLLSVITAFALRFDTLSVVEYLTQSWFFAVLLVALRLPLFYAFGFYRRLWRYASVAEYATIIEAVLLSSMIAAVVVQLLLPLLRLIEVFPRSVIFIEVMLALLFIGGLRFSAHLRPASRAVPRARAESLPAESPKRVVIFGAGDAGALIAREMRANPSLGLRPIAFVDDDAGKRGLRIHDIPVLGNREQFRDLARTQPFDLAVLAMPTAPGRVIREITETCRLVDVPVKTMPGLYQILGEQVKVSVIREVELEDLLRREPVTIDLAQVGRYLRGAQVLVTGAGGSIGSELCRQIARFEPRHLILFELGENNLYQIHRELAARFPALRLLPIIGDVRDKGQVQDVFATHQPQVVFHAAAHKHVPLMESNPEQVVANNVFGTWNVLQASRQNRAHRFVLISTDKAVNPKSVMGASKRVAELFIRDPAQRAPNFAPVAVRFGNVLGSSGSVVPLFKEQIAAGGPVTVTHPDIKRYFMTIPEAVSLIIQAAAMGEGGEIFVLDMGEPVKIVDLARDLIRLSGFEPEQEIEIEFTGLRAGEKMDEALFYAAEERAATKHPQIQVARAAPADHAAVQRALTEMESVLLSRDGTAVREKLKQVVPEYSPK